MRGADGDVRAHFRVLADWLAETPAERVAEKRREADLLFHRVGITFAVYGDDAGAERLIPFDTIPRVIPKAEWDELANGLRQRVHAVEHYPGLLLETLRAAAPPAARDPLVAVLTPGQHNSAYFEHAFLAQQMGVELVEGVDLFVKDGFVHMRTTSGPQRVDVIYRRIDDAFLDPLAFRQDSLLGVPGLLSVCRAGTVALANAIGTGVADDKPTNPYVPEMIPSYLGVEPRLQSLGGL